LTSTESKTFATDNSTIALWKLTEILLKITSFDDLLVKDSIEMAVANNIIANGSILFD
jgi:hypothetical protein